VRWRFQANPNVDGGQGNVIGTINELSTMTAFGVHLIREPQTGASYRAFIAHADLLLLPYRRRPYRRRSSAVLLEALVAGVPVVTTSGTWLAEQVVKYKAGVVVEPDRVTEGVISAIRHVASSSRTFGGVHPDLALATSADVLVAQLVEPPRSAFRAAVRNSEAAFEGPVVRAWTSGTVRLFGAQEAIDAVRVTVGGVELAAVRVDDAADARAMTYAFGRGEGDCPARVIELVRRGPDSFGGRLALEVRECLAAGDLWEFTESRNALFPPEGDDGGQFCWARSATVEIALALPVAEHHAVLIDAATSGGSNGWSASVGLTEDSAISVTQGERTSRGLPVPESDSASRTTVLRLGCDCFGPASETDDRQIGLALRSVTIVSRSAVETSRLDRSQ